MWNILVNHKGGDFIITRNEESIYSNCRYIPDRQEMNKEFSGLISPSDFDTCGCHGHQVAKIVSAEIFNRTYKAIAQQNLERSVTNDTI